MTAVDPVYVGAVAALSGVTLTVVAQATIGKLQRRHDRAAKLFDLKLDLYITFAAALKEVGSAVGDREATVRELRRLTAKSSELNGRAVSPESAAKEFQLMHTQTDGSVKIEPAELQEAVAVLDGYKKIAAERSELQGELAALQSKHSAEASRISAATGTILNLMPKVSLITEDRLQSELVIVVEKIKVAKQLNRNDFTNFEYAARKELGVPRARLSGKYRQGRRWIIKKKIAYRAKRRLRSTSE